MGINNQIALQIINNFNATVEIDIFTNQITSSQVNAKTLYQWDLLTETFIGVSMVQIEYKKPSDILFKLSDGMPLKTLNFSGVSNALNNLEYCLFFPSIKGVFTFTDNFVFGNVIIT